MKKIIVGIFSLVLLLTAHNVFAAGIWNQSQDDCQDISIANFTTNTGFGNPCWPNTNIGANPGEAVNVRIYYHNTGNVNATNTKVSLTADYSSGTQHTFTAKISSPQGELSTGSVSVTIPSSQTLTFGSTRWYPNQTQTAYGFLDGQSGSEVMSGGLNIGTIAPGWGTQGSVVVSFRVGSAITNQNCAINSFNPNPSSITKGDSSTLSWSTSNCTSVTISNLGYNVPTSGSQTVSPTQTTTYKLIAYGSNGETQNRSITVYVNGTNSNICSVNISATDTSISNGNSTTLEWNTNNCDRVKISDIGDVSNSGSKRVYPSGDTTYVITGYNTDGSHVTDSVKIYVNNNNNNSNCSIDSFSANKVNINSNDAVTLRWSTSGCDTVNISGIGNVSNDGSKVVYPSSTTIYVLRAYGNNTETRSIQVNVNNSPVTINNCSVTTVATNVNQTGAQLNGMVTNSLGSNAYFEYGSTINLGNRTTSRFVNTNSNFTEMVSNLSPNTIYFFRLVSNCQNGTAYGNTEIFRTTGYVNTNTKNTRIIRETIVQQGNTVIGSESPVILRIENKYQTIGVGDIIDYVVYYKNISGSVLTNPMVQVTIPEGITLLNASRGTYSESDRILSAPIENLNPYMEGVIYIQARVDSINSTLSQIVTTVVLVYTNPNGAQENAMAYVLNNPRIGGSLLGASAFYGNIFGLSLIGWLLLIILIMLLVLIARSFYGRRNVIVTPAHTNNL